jgi:hypothetical protein
MAWLHATPSKAKVSRQKEFEAKVERGESAPFLELPNIEGLSYIVDYLFEVGPMTGESSVTWQEVRAWREETGVTLDDFEVTSIVALSKAYAGMLYEARDPMTPPPHVTSIASLNEQKARAATRLRQILGSMNSATAKRNRARRQVERDGKES